MKNIKTIAESAIIAALYVAVTWLLAPISYGAIQFRVSEVLVLLVFYNKKYFLPLVIGCFVSNITSSLGMYDMIFGTAATLLSLLMIRFCKNIWIAAIFPVLFNGFIIAFELSLLEIGEFWFNVVTIAIGETGVLYILGIPLILMLSKNKAISELLEFQK